MAGPLDADTQMVIDLAEFDLLIARTVIAPLDGTLLNESVAEFASGAALPTCEGIARLIRDRVAKELPAGVRPYRVRVAEDETLWADCIG